MPAWSQSSSSGTISGQVTDQQHAAIVGAEVVIVDPTTNITSKTKTNQDGRYIFTSVNPRTYIVTFTHTGFTTRRLGAVDVQVGRVTTIDATLDVGQISSVVEVTTAPGAELQTVNATVGTTVRGDSLAYLPVFGADISSLAMYQPGVGVDGQVAGAMYDQNTFQLDGGNNSNDMDGSMKDYTGSYSRGAFASTTDGGNPPSGVVPTPADTIEEFKVATAGQTADFNGSSGSQIQMVTKRGTNQFHGSAYYFYNSSDVGGANTWDNNHTPSGNLGYTPIPITHNQRYGFTVGGPLLPKLAGGKTYFFFGMEGFNFPQSALVNRQDPTDALRKGIIQINQGGTYVPYNMTNSAVTFNGQTLAPAACAGGFCDPRGIGLNPLIAQLWNKYMPTPNNLNTGDAHNVEGFQGQVSLPEKTKFLVGRVDHDFNEKWRFMSSYRYYGLTQLTTNQIDIGGALPGDTLGTPVARAPRPQKPSFLVGGLTTNISPTLTNEFHYSYTRIWWQWGSSAAPPQLPGLGGALEIGGETANALIPYNVNNQNTRQRFWDGHDQQVKDDLVKIVGNHVISFGGTYGRNYDFHSRNDNGQGINTSPVYQVGNNAGIQYGNYVPSTIPGSQVATWDKYYSYVLGLVDQPQQLFTRTGPSLTLNPAGTPMFDQSTIPSYNLYITDSWHIKPSLTITYGLGYQVEMPPTEKNGKHVELVNSTGNPINFTNYFNTKSQQALGGTVYNPIIGFSTIGNVTGASHKYPFNPYYGGLSPRVAAAWNPKFGSGILGKAFGDGKSVLRAGYGQIYSRLNGVGLVLIPLLGVGLGQPVSCIGASSSGQCLGSGGVTPATAFRIGSDGLKAPIPTPTTTLPQPSYPGTNGSVAAGAASVLDPSFRPAATYNFNVSIQREIKPKMLIEVGYIGRIITHEWMQRDLDAVPTMMTLNGQSFANAFSKTYFSVCGSDPLCSNPATSAPAQPFFESALGGANSAFCAGFGSCTNAVVKNAAMNSFISQTQVFQLWSALSNAPSWSLGRTIPSSQSAAIPSGQASGIYADDASGSANYNALFTTFTARDYHGVTTQSNFTWGRALGTGNQSQATSSYTVLNPYNVRESMYGPQFWDVKFTYTQTFLWTEPFFRSEKGIVGHVLGGWRIAPIFAARSGAPIPIGTLNSNESFGETQTGGAFDGAVLAAPFTGGTNAHYNINIANSATGAGTNGNLANGGNNINMFSNPTAVFNEFRPCVLGYDTSCGSGGQIRGLSSWNMDMNVAKDFRLWGEKAFATMSFQFVNVFNHVVLGDPNLSIASPQDWGVLGSNENGQANAPRNLTFSLRVKF